MNETMTYRFAVVTAVVVAVAAVAYGYDALRADQAVPPQGVAASMVVATSTMVTATATPMQAPVATMTESVEFDSRDFAFQVRGGDNPCRYLYTSNRVGTFAGREIIVEFIAGTHDGGLAATGEMHLYGDTGPHLFEIENADGGVILIVAVDRGATVRAAVLFPTPGLYRLYDRLYGHATHVSEITARPIDQAGSVAVTEWCPAKDSAP